MEIIEKLKRLLYKLNSLKQQITYFCRQNNFNVRKEHLEYFIKQTNEILKDLSEIREKHYDTFVKSAKLGEIESIINNVTNIKRLLSKCIYYNTTPDPNLRIVDPNSFQDILSNVDTAYNKIENLVSYFGEHPTMVVYPGKDIKKDENIKRQDLEKENKINFKQKNEILYNLNKKTNKIFENFKEKFQDKSKKEEQKNILEKLKKSLEKKESLIFKILSFIVVVLSVTLAFVYDNIIFVIIVFIIALVILALFGKKSISWIISWSFVGVIIIFIIYVFVHTTFSRVLCIFLPTLCPQKMEKATEKQLTIIKESVLETINKIKNIMENPELAYVESKAESVATREAYRYLFEIQSVNEVPLNYIFYSDNEEVKEIFSLPLYYAVRYSLPIDKEFNITFDAYCLTEPLFKKECILLSQSQDLGVIRTYDKKEVFFNKDLNYYGTIKITDKLGMINIKCTVPRFYINLSNCTELTWNYFYINNHLLLLLSNVTTRTVYKFLVIDENTLVKSILENRDIYDYLKLNREEYDKGYFEGFLDFPKINILRLGVLSEYPVIKFRDMSNISDFIYVSLTNIKDIANIKKFEVEIIYDPRQLEISLDSKFDGIETSLYKFSCQKEIGKIYCSAVFQNFYDSFNRNLYLIYYRGRLEKLFFFIPISISFSKDFVEYSEVIINARAEYDIEKLVTTEMEYRIIKI